jgi:hypothetical protein
MLTTEHRRSKLGKGGFDEFSLEELIFAVKTYAGQRLVE